MSDPTPAVELLIVNLDVLADAIHQVGKTGEGPEDRYLEVNSDQLAVAIWDRLHGYVMRVPEV